MLDRIDRDLRENKRVYIANNYSNEGILILQERLKKAHPNKKIVAICRETLNRPDVGALLEDTTRWKNYDAIISSPSIQGGLSCDCEGAFDNIYGLFNNGSCGAADAIQMLGRVRKPKNNIVRVHIKMLNTIQATDNEDDYMNYLLANREHTFESGILNAVEWDYNGYRQVEFKNDWFLKFYCKVKSREIRTARRWIFHFMKLQAQAGNTLNYVSSTLKKEEIKTSNRKTTEAKITVTEQRVIALEEARDITDDQYKELQDKKTKTPEEDLELERRYMREHYGYAGKMSNQFIFKYSKKKIMKAYTNRLLFINERNTEQNLKNLRDKEAINDRKSNRARLEEGRHRVSEATTKAIIKSISYNFKYPKFNLLMSWLMILGFEKLDSSEVLDRQDLKLNLMAAINTMDFDKVARILGKSKRRMNTIKNLSHTDKDFIKYGLGFINGAMRAEFGYVITATDKHSTHYRISDDYPTFFKRPGTIGTGYELIQDREKYKFQQLEKPSEPRETTEPSTDEVARAMERLGIKF